MSSNSGPILQKMVFSQWSVIDACQFTISHADIMEIPPKGSSRMSHLFFLSRVTSLKLAIHLNTQTVMKFAEPCHIQQITQKFHLTSAPFPVMVWHIQGAFSSEIRDKIKWNYNWISVIVFSFRHTLRSSLFPLNAKEIAICKKNKRRRIKIGHVRVSEKLFVPKKKCKNVLKLEINKIQRSLDFFHFILNKGFPGWQKESSCLADAQELKLNISQDASVWFFKNKETNIFHMRRG